MNIDKINQELKLRDMGIVTDKSQLESIDARYFIDRYPGNHRLAQNVTSHHPKRYNFVWRDGCSYIFVLKNGRICVVVNGVNLTGIKAHVKTIFKIVKGCVRKHKPKLIRKPEKRKAVMYFDRLAKEELPLPVPKQVQIKCGHKSIDEDGFCTSCIRKVE